VFFVSCGIKAKFIRNPFDPPSRLAILPMNNLTNDLSGPEVVRTIFQGSIVKKGYQVVRDYVGHGIGRNIHEEPQVPNYGKPGHGPRIEDGLVLAIEPMVTAGHYAVKTLSDGWTVVTQDGKLASHYEDTVAFMDGKVFNLTGDDNLRSE